MGGRGICSIISGRCCFQSQTLTDLSLVCCDGITVKHHQLILAACSEILLECLNDDTDTVVLPDHCGASVRKCMEAVYGFAMQDEDHNHDTVEPAYSGHVGTGTFGHYKRVATLSEEFYLIVEPFLTQKRPL